MNELWELYLEAAWIFDAVNNGWEMSPVWIWAANEYSWIAGEPATPEPLIVWCRVNGLVKDEMIASEAVTVRDNATYPGPVQIV